MSVVVESEETTTQSRYVGPVDTFDLQMQRAVRRLKLMMRVVSLVLVALTAAGYVLGLLNPWEAFFMCNAIPILITGSLLLNYESDLMRRLIQSEFKRNSLMALGSALTLPGLALLTTSLLGGSVAQVMFQCGSGTSLICSGLYFVRRFAD